MNSKLVLRTHGVTVGLVAAMAIVIANGGDSDAIHRGPLIHKSSTRFASSERACPLTPAQERSAVSAFDKMMPVLFHPRCVNCHGAVNPYVAPQIGHHLGGQMTDSATGAALPDAACQDCHSGLPGWMVTGQPLFFIGKSAKDLCIQFKEFEPSGADFMDHIIRDHGNIQFIPTSFLGTRALNTLGEVAYEDAMGRPPVPEKPPVSHQQFIAQAQAWVDAINPGWTADPDCGCMVHGAWYGTVTSSGTFDGMPGTLNVSSRATVMLETDHSWDQRGSPHTQYYKSTGGLAAWVAQASGLCSGGLSGDVPLDGLDVDGHPMAELRIEDHRDGTFSYLPTIGSWPDRWSPLFTIRCNLSGTMVDFPTTNLNTGWWQYDPQNLPVTRDPDRLQGSYRWNPAPGIDVLWTWDLKRQP